MTDLNWKLSVARTPLSTLGVENILAWRQLTPSLSTFLSSLPVQDIFLPKSPGPSSMVLTPITIATRLGLLQQLGLFLHVLD